MKKLFLVIIIFNITMSCNKGESPEANLKPIRFNAFEIQNIGKLHNEYVKRIMNKVDLNSLNWSDEVKSISNQFGGNIIDCKFAGIPVVPNLNESMASHFNDGTVKLYSRLINAILSEYSNVSDLNKQLEIIELSAKSLKNPAESEFIKICISVAKSSSILWLPTGMGGEGFYNYISEKIISSTNIHNKLKQRQLTPCQEEVVAGDVAGAAASVMSLGIFAIFGEIPGTNAIIAAKIAYDSAVASAATYAVSKACHPE